MRELERVIMLRVVDEYWMDHIDAMDELKQGIDLRAYGQNDPVVEYKMRGLRHVRGHGRSHPGGDRRAACSPCGCRTKRGASSASRWPSSPPTAGGDGTVRKQQPVRKKAKIGRNDPCPCGSGLKWKKCTCKEYHPDLQ